MIRRAVLSAAFATVLALLVLGAGTRASADDAPPTIPFPSEGPSSGPTYVITPGVGGSELPEPSDPKAVEKAKQADRAQHAQQGAQQREAPRHGHAASPLPQGTEEPGLANAQSAGRQTPLTRVAPAQEQVGPVLRGFAALVAMVVLYEITAVRRFVFRRRRGAVTAG